MKSIKLAAVGVALGAAGLARVDAGPMTIGSSVDGSKIRGTTTNFVFDTELAQMGAQEKKSEQEKKADQEKKAAAQQKAADEANDKSVTISSPADKSKIPGPSTNIVFDVVPAAAGSAIPAASKADHVHVYVDGERVAQLRGLKGSYAVDKLVTGKHWLCIRVVDKAETPVGLEKCVEVTAGDVPPMRYNKSVFFIEPKDGAVVTSPFKVVFGMRGMAVEPAGEVKADSGHHHLLINLGPMNAGEAIPVDSAHLHFGKAQSEAEIKLPPGNYKLTLQFANGAHVSYGPQMASSINVTVK